MLARKIRLVCLVRARTAQRRKCDRDRQVVLGVADAASRSGGAAGYHSRAPIVPASGAACAEGMHRTRCGSGRGRGLRAGRLLEARRPRGDGHLRAQVGEAHRVTALTWPSARPQEPASRRSQSLNVYDSLQESRASCPSLPATPYEPLVTPLPTVTRAHRIPSESPTTLKCFTIPSRPILPGPSHAHSSQPHAILTVIPVVLHIRICDARLPPDGGGRLAGWRCR